MRTTARTALRLLLLMVVVSSLLVGTAGCTSSGTKITIFTGGTAGVYFPLGSKYAEMLNKHSDLIDASAVTSGASVTNAKAIGTNECQAALLQNDVSYYALKGTNMFDAPVPELRGVACLYPETIQFVVLADSPIKSLADLAGKNVAVGAPGSGTAVACEQILTAAGVWNSITRFDLNFAEAASAIKLGEVDAGFIVAGAPTPAIEELAISSPVRILDIPDNVLNGLLSAGYPFYVRQLIPHGTYGMTGQQVATVAVQAMLAVRSDLTEAVVYDMTKILFTQIEELRTAHTKGNEVSLQTALDGMSLKLHPGAIKYYKEAGVNVPAGMT